MEVWGKHHTTSSHMELESEIEWMDCSRCWTMDEHIHVECYGVMTWMWLYNMRFHLSSKRGHIVL